MDDTEFSKRVAKLRAAYRDEFLDVVGGDDGKLFSGTKDEFMDSYSIGIHATVSMLATLLSAYTTRLVLDGGQSFDEALVNTNNVLTIYCNEVLKESANAAAMNINMKNKSKILN